jgi:iron complex outermembrane receptor protein
MVRYKLPAVRFTLLIFLITAIPAVRLHAGGTLFGTVTGKPGKFPLIGAHLVTGTDQKGAFTDDNGTFRIVGLSPGRHLVRATYLGYKSEEQWITIKEGKTTRCDFSLEPESLSAPEVEIIDSKRTRIMQEQPARMELISAESIINNPGLNVVSALDVISGVNLSGTMGIYSNNTVISMRGMSGNDQGRTLVLIDDVPMNKADAGSVNWNLVNRENVENIEVIKGPGPAQYGSNAMGGVINIHTRQPEKLITGVISGNYGTFNTLGLRYSMGGKVRKKELRRGFLWGLNGFYRRSDGYNSEIPEYLEPGDTFYVNNYLREVSVGAKVGYQFNDLNQLEVNASFFNDKRGRGVEIYEVDGAYERHKTLQGNLRYRGGAKSGRWKFLAFSTDEWFERLNEYMKEGEYNLYLVESKRVDRGAGLSYEIPLGSKHRFTTGIDYRFGSVFGQDIYYTSTDIITNQGKMDTWAAFLQDEIRLLNEKLQFNIGLRMNLAYFHDGKFNIENPSYSIQYLVDYQDSAYQSGQWIQLDPKFSLQYRFTPVSRLYFSAARGFRAPALDDLCRTGKIRNGFKIANPDLHPEIVDNLELGGDMVLMKKIRLAASCYFSIGKDFMYYVSTGDSVNMGYKLTPVFVKRNISQVLIAGFEVDASADPLSWLSLFANYTFNHSVISQFDPVTAADKDLNGKFLTDVPMHKISSGVTWKNKILNVNFIWKYVGERYINDENATDIYLQTDKYPAYNTVGLKVWHIYKKRFTFALNVDNLFDTRYIDDRLQQNPGRMANIEVTLTF